MATTRKKGSFRGAFVKGCPGSWPDTGVWPSPSVLSLDNAPAPSPLEAGSLSLGITVIVRKTVRQLDISSGNQIILQRFTAVDRYSVSGAISMHFETSLSPVTSQASVSFRIMHLFMKKSLSLRSLKGPFRKTGRPFD